VSITFSHSGSGFSVFVWGNDICEVYEMNRERDRVELFNLCGFMGKRALWVCIENISESILTNSYCMPS
jgi:hypothetical protein